MKERMTESNNQDLLIDRIADKVSNSKLFKTGLAVLGVGGLTGCVATSPTVETVPTPAEGQALPIGLLNAERISSLPEGEVKNSLQAELSSVKEECISIPGCMGDTVQIYRVIVPDNAYSIRFANFKTENEAEHTEILNMMDGKTQETTTIQKDLKAVEGVVNGVETKAFGYVDDLGNSHYIYVDQGDKQYLYDTQNNIYEVKTQNEKEVQAYASFWGEPIVAQAASLPTPTAGVSATPEPTATEIVAEKSLVEKLVFEREIPNLSQEEMAKIVAGAYRFKDSFGQIYSLGYIPQMVSYFSTEAIVIDLEKSTSSIDGDEFWRLLMITEDKKAGGFETTGEKKYMIMPMYIDNDKEKKYRISMMVTPGGVTSTESSSPVEVDTLISALNEQKEKHGYFQINAVSHFTVSDYDLEMSKSLSDWPDREKRLMRIYNNSKEAEIFVKYMLSNDYDSAVSYMKSENPYLLAIYIALSSD